MERQAPMHVPTVIRVMGMPVVYVKMVRQLALTMAVISVSSRPAVVVKRVQVHVPTVSRVMAMPAVNVKTARQHVPTAVISVN